MVLEAKQVVVLVITKSTRAYRAIGDHQIDVRLARDKHPGIGEMLHQRRWWIVANGEIRYLETPPVGLPAPADPGVRQPLRPAQSQRSRRQKVTRIASVPISVAGENMQSPVVGIADLRNTTVGAHGSQQVVDHQGKPALVLIRKRLSQMAEQTSATQKQLAHQTVVGQRRFEVRAVR